MFVHIFLITGHKDNKTRPEIKTAFLFIVGSSEFIVQPAVGKIAIRQSTIGNLNYPLSADTFFA
jgi:hypothetical protein